MLAGFIQVPKKEEEEKMAPLHPSKCFFNRRLVEMEMTGVRKSWGGRVSSRRHAVKLACSSKGVKGAPLKLPLALMPDSARAKSYTAPSRPRTGMRWTLRGIIRGSNVI
ncbi:hypothetical protein BHM03_00027074 [Ensete ventricosum]|nr:hypothetical protein BHM03_00027074 [Ensete ventricosum]